jgi:hypothetical protein
VYGDIVIERKRLVKVLGMDSSDLVLTRGQILSLGLSLLLLGLLEMVGAYFVAHSVTMHQSEASSQAIAQAKECKTRLAALGFEATLKGNTITANIQGINDAAYKLGKASIASLSCAGWSLSKFCMGEGCGSTGGIQLELQPVKVH